MMKKFVRTSLCLLVCTGILTGCGKTVDSATSMVYVDKKGAVVSIDVEELDQTYYDETELKSYVNEAVEDYTKENGKNTVKADSITVEDKMAKLTMKYKTPEDYAAFNGIEMYQGKVVKALAAGYDFNMDFVSVADGKVTGTASREDIYAADDYKVVIIKANTDVHVDGDICYVSSENVKLTGSNSVSIREGYDLGMTENVMETESVGGTADVLDTEIEENTDTVFEQNDSSFETDVYTYIIYK